MDLEKFTHSCYVPYSNKASICVVKSVKGNYFPGVRVENASFPLTISAYQNAIFNCLSEKEQPKAIYVQQADAKELEFWKQEFNVWVHPFDSLGNIPFKRIMRQVKRKEILKTLTGLLEDAYTPNSDFPVSALLQTEEGFIAGVNIECSDWSRGLCAERVAVAKALAYGMNDLGELHILTKKGEYRSPCGACRQVLFEHIPHRPVHMYHKDGTHSVHYASDLLPYSFRSSSLAKNNDHKS